MLAIEGLDRSRSTPGQWMATVGAKSISMIEAKSVSLSSPSPRVTSGATSTSTWLMAPALNSSGCWGAVLCEARVLCKGPGRKR